MRTELVRRSFTCRPLTTGIDFLRNSDKVSRSDVFARADGAGVRVLWSSYECFFTCFLFTVILACFNDVRNVVKMCVIEAFLGKAFPLTVSEMGRDPLWMLFTSMYIRIYDTMQYDLDPL